MNQTTRAVRACIAILLAISLTACVTRLGRDFDEAAAKQIKSGETTKAELLKTLGRPSLVTGPDAEEVWTYAFFRGRNFAYNLMQQVGFLDADAQMQGTQKRLVITFKGDSVKEWQLRDEIPLANRANR